VISLTILCLISTQGLSFALPSALPPDFFFVDIISFLGIISLMSRGLARVQMARGMALHI